MTGHKTGGGGVQQGALASRIKKFEIFGVFRWVQYLNGLEDCFLDVLIVWNENNLQINLDI